MRFLTLVTALIALPVSIVNAQHAVSVDYNGDCTVDTRDIVAFLTAFNQRSTLAELTGDGIVDSQDAVAFLSAADRDPGAFTVHWSVTTQFGQSAPGIGYRMDGSFGEDPDHPDIDKSQLPVATDTVILYHYICGEFPLTGPAELFNRFGDPALWAESYQDWYRAHETRILELIPPLLTSNDPPYTYGIIDYEGWLLRWVDMRRNAPTNPPLNEICVSWVQLVDAINSPRWDEAFFQDTGYTTPPGTTGIGQLSDEDRELAYKLSYDSYVRWLYEHTINTLRVADDAVGGVKWSFWRSPKTHWDRPTRQVDRDRNDELSWLYTTSDVLSPRFYRKYYTTDDPSDDGPRGPNYVRSTQDQALDWASAMQETLRVRDRYCPDAEIIPFVWWHYQFSPKDGNYHFLNQHDVLESIRISRQWGADGIYIWGYTHPDPQNPDIAEPATREEIQHHLDTEWRDLLRNAVCE